jgi:ubiquinone/menaquinone biosynthesis C-methylase UbiE
VPVNQNSEGYKGVAMIQPKEFYRTYQADDSIVELNRKLAHEVMKESPNHVLEFGTGTGKNLKLIQSLQMQYAKVVAVSGIDISLINVLHATVKNGLPHVSLGDENYLRHYCNFDVVITCSVLDHVENIEGIIQELQRIANKCVIIAECTESDPANYYYSHDFEKYGFEKLPDSEYYSTADNHVYNIYKWKKRNEAIVDFPNDDLGNAKT